MKMKRNRQSRKKNQPISTKTQSEPTKLASRSEERPRHLKPNIIAVGERPEPILAKGGMNAEAKTAQDNDQWWYIERYFIYTNELLERTERRANNLMVANSALIVAYFSILQIISNDVLNSKVVELHFREAILSQIPTLAFLASVISAVSSSLPKVMDAEIPINQGTIAKQTQEFFIGFVRNRPKEAMIHDFLMETHVLTRILDFKSVRVAVSAKLFIIGAVLAPVTIALISYI
jgi:hypothetical protein